MARPGAISYLQIPAPDPARSADFYGAVFGWRVHDAEGERPSFDTPDGQLSGAWIRGLPPASTGGLLPYIYVDRMEETVAAIVDRGGRLESPPEPEGMLSVATFRDPAGNLLGLWHDTTR